ncbi:selenium-dependent molybdenum cofactor biosynthesis protein YqeB [Chloroflexota bacterium]
MVPIFKKILIVVRGGGDLASGVVYRLVQAGFSVVILELETPLFVRRAVSFGDAVYSGTTTIDGITACLAAQSTAIHELLAQNIVPVRVDPDGLALQSLQPLVVIDARMAKRPLDTQLIDAPLVVALGPSFEAGVHCHAVVETNRGHSLGRVYWTGQAQADTGLPGSVQGFTEQRILRAPTAGYVKAYKQVGETVAANDVIAEVDGLPVSVSFTGVLRGLVHPDAYMAQGAKIGDVDPRATCEHCFTISDKSLAVGGGVLEAVLAADVVCQALASQVANCET